MIDFINLEANHDIIYDLNVFWTLDSPMILYIKYIIHKYIREKITVIGEMDQKRFGDVVKYWNGIYL